MEEGAHNDKETSFGIININESTGMQLELCDCSLQDLIN